MMATNVLDCVAWISSTLGEEYSCGGSLMGWSAYSVNGGDYTVLLTGYPDGPAIQVFFGVVGTNKVALEKLYAVVGWAVLHGVECKHDWAGLVSGQEVIPGAS